MVCQTDLWDYGVMGLFMGLWVCLWGYGVTKAELLLPHKTEHHFVKVMLIWVYGASYGVTSLLLRSKNLLLAIMVMG